MSDDTILCWKGRVKVADYRAWIKERENGKAKIADFFRDRLRERYVESVQHEKENGFCIMAVSCLLIETLETFKQGWISSDGKSARSFCYFFDREERFSNFKGFSQQFYENVRCGILHQGETTGGWTIRRNGELFDKAELTINATEFQKALVQVIDDYTKELKSQPLSADVWKKFIKKMDATVSNCEC